MDDQEAFEHLLAALPLGEDIPLAENLKPFSDLSRAQLDAFLNVWNELDPARRQQLLTTLGHQADTHIELQFDRINQAALSDSDAVVRRIAVRNLWESQDSKLVPMFLDMIANDPSTEVRAVAIEAVGRFVLMGQLSKIDSHQLKEIEDLLLEILSRENDMVLHGGCIESLGYSSRPEVESIIQQAYESQEERLQTSSIIAMGRTANEIWDDAILQEMESHSPMLRAVAAKAAGEVELRSAIPSLIDLLEDVNDSVRANAIWSLGQIGGNVARDALETIADSLRGDPLHELVNEALEYIAFLEGTPNFFILDFEEDEGDLA